MFHEVDEGLEAIEAGKLDAVTGEGRCAACAGGVLAASHQVPLTHGQLRILPVPHHSGCARFQLTAAAVPTYALRPIRRRPPQD